MNEDDARRFEESLESRGDGIAGEPPSTTPPLPSTEPAAEDGQIEELDAVVDTAVAKRAGKTRSPERPAAGYGTRKNPRERKTDGVKTRSTSVHLPIDIAMELTMYCARNGFRQSEVITRALEALLRRAR